MKVNDRERKAFGIACKAMLAGSTVQAITTMFVQAKLYDDGYQHAGFQARAASVLLPALQAGSLPENVAHGVSVRQNDGIALVLTNDGTFLVLNERGDILSAARTMRDAKAEYASIRSGKDYYHRKNYTTPESEARRIERIGYVHKEGLVLKSQRKLGGKAPAGGTAVKKVLGS